MNHNLQISKSLDMSLHVLTTLKYQTHQQLRNSFQWRTRLMLEIPQMCRVIHQKLMMSDPTPDLTYKNVDMKVLFLQRQFSMNISDKNTYNTHV
jgi:hypothetical protein